MTVTKPTLIALSLKSNKRRQNHSAPPSRSTNRFSEQLKKRAMSRDPRDFLFSTSIAFAISAQLMKYLKPPTAKQRLFPTPASLTSTNHRLHQLSFAPAVRSTRRYSYRS